MAIWVALVVTWLFSESYNNPLGNTDKRTHDLGYVLDVLARFDTGWLLGIADKGYSFNRDASAFSRSTQLSVGVLGRVLLDNFLLAGSRGLARGVRSSITVLLYRLGTRLVGGECRASQRSLPCDLPDVDLLGSPHTDSLYLMLDNCGVLFASEAQWLSAGLTSGLAILTRTSGVALLVALPLLAWKSTNRLHAMTRLAISVPVAALYPLYLWIDQGKPFIFFSCAARRLGPEDSSPWPAHRYRTWPGRRLPRHSATHRRCPINASLLELGD